MRQKIFAYLLLASTALMAIDIDLGNLSPEQMQMYQQYKSGGMSAVKGALGANSTGSTNSQNQKEDAPRVKNNIPFELLDDEEDDKKEQTPQELLTEQEEKERQEKLAYEAVKKNPFLYENSDTLVEKLYKKKMQLEKEELKRYSERFFLNENALDTQQTPVPSNYIIMPGDVINVTLYGGQSQEHSVKVNRSGSINIPKVGAIKVASLAYNDATKLIEQKLKKAFLNTEVIVDMVQFVGIQVMITGDVKYPGLYNLSSFSTIKDALVASRGVATQGSVRRVTLKRDGKDIATLDLYRLMKFADSSSDKLLRQGDIIHIDKAHKLVTLKGEVVNEAIYELTNKENFKNLFTYASGVKPSANALGVRLTRFENNKHTKVYTLDFNELQKMLPQNGDVVEVAPLSEINSKKVAFYGNVAVEGNRELPKDKKLSTLMHKESMGIDNFFLPNTAFEHAIIKRLDTQKGYSLVRFNILDVINGTKDITLQANDEVYIFNKLEIKQNPYVYVGGDVIEKDKHKYRYYNGMTLGDLTAVVQFKTENILGDENQTQQQEQLMQMMQLQGTPQQKARPNDMELTKEEEITTRKPLWVDEEYIRINRVDDEGYKQFSLSLKKHANFEMRPFDEVEFFDYFETHQDHNITLYGEFNKPGAYAFTEGMTFEDALKLGGGLTHRAFKQNIELVRYTIKNDQRVSEVKVIDITKGNDNFVLQDGDEIYVRTIANWRDHEYITIEGEVKYPGKYQIIRGERLSNVIARAGGFLSTAFIEGAVFTRQSIQKLQEEELEKSLDELNMKAAMLASQGTKAGESAQDKARMLETIQNLTEQAKKIKPQGRITVELARSLKEFEDSPYNVILEPGDKLFVPMKTSVVTLVGEVLNANSFIYKKGQTVQDYIRKSGGPRHAADLDNIFVVRANGDAMRYWRWFFFEGNNDVKKGDVIIVPKKLDVSSGLKLAQDIADVGYKLAISIAALKTLGMF